MQHFLVLTVSNLFLLQAGKNNKERASLNFQRTSFFELRKGSEAPLPLHTLGAKTTIVIHSQI